MPLISARFEVYHPHVRSNGLYVYFVSQLPVCESVRAKRNETHIELPTYPFLGLQVCIARNALAAVIYWCQGKRQCRFSKSFVTDAAKFKQYFVSEPAGSYKVAQDACHAKKGRLAWLKATADTTNAKDVVVKRDRKQFRGRERFWVSKATKDHLHRLNVTWTEKRDGHDCMILAKNYTKVRLNDKFYVSIGKHMT